MPLPLREPTAVPARDEVGTAESTPTRHLEVVDLGRISYADAMRLQDDLVEARLKGEAPDTLLLLEHDPPVFTLGRRGSLHDVYLSEEVLWRVHGIEVHRTTRGGLVTYHGPGQVVGYAVVKLREAGLTVPNYVHGLERAVQAALQTFGVEQTYTDVEHVGVWTQVGKIAAVGVGLRHGVSLHGFAVNLQPDPAHFALINPCGIGDLGVATAVQILRHPVDISEFKIAMAQALAVEFGYQVRNLPAAIG